jgi:phosphate starvation-inducible protein PhoH
MKDKKQSALVKVMDLFEDSDLIGTVKFTDEDCVRNPIIPYLLDKIKTLE